MHQYIAHQHCHIFSMVCTYQHQTLYVCVIHSPTYTSEVDWA